VLFELCKEFGLSMALNIQKLRHVVIGFAWKHITAPSRCNVHLERLQKLAAFQCRHL
jgi:hypothetical protein